MLDRTPPHSLEAERGVLSSLFLDSRLCDDVAPILRVDEFHVPAHRAIYSAIVTIHEDGRAVDTTGLLELLKERGDLERIGGLTALVEILESAPAAMNATWFAGRVRDCAIKRELIRAATEVLRDAYELGADAQDVLGRSNARMAAIEERRIVSEAVDVGEALPLVLEEIDARMKGTPSGVPTPWYELTRKIGCFRDGEFYVLGARPRMGKTAISLNIAQHVAEVWQQPALFISLEMGRGELLERMLSARAGVNGEALRDGRLSDGDRSKLVTAACELSEMRLKIDDKPGRTVADIAAQARSLKRKGQLTILVIDHLSLLTPDNHRDQRQEQISKMTRRLKLLAKELRIPILLLCQLNRETEKRPDHRPKLSDLRESGAIEQDAGIVLFVHRESEYRPEDPDLHGKAELIVAKNRSGRTGVVNLAWDAATTTFSEVDREFKFD